MPWTIFFLSFLFLLQYSIAILFRMLVWNFVDVLFLILLNDIIFVLRTFQSTGPKKNITNNLFLVCESNGGFHCTLTIVLLHLIIVMLSCTLDKLIL